MAVLSKLRDAYLGQHVVIYLRDMNIVAVKPEGEGEMLVSGMLEGYVVDIDDKYWYIGGNPEEFNRIVLREIAGIVEIQMPDNSSFLLTNNMEIMEPDDGGVH